MKAVIVEDEKLIARILQSKVKKLAPEIEIVAVLTSLKKTRQWLTDNQEPDLMFMDIQLGDGVSFELFDTHPLSCPVIFTTAYDEYAIKAFQVNGIDYLLKPVKEEELLRAINKCKKMIGHSNTAVSDMKAMLEAMLHPAGQSVYKEKFLVQMRNQVIPVNTSDIACFSREILNYAYLHSGERYSLEQASLDEIEKLLDPRKFFRVNRQYIVNIDAIQAVKAVEHAKLVITLKAPNNKLSIDTSRLRTAAFRSWLNR